MGEYSDLVKKAEVILRSKSNQIDDDGWVSREVFDMKFMPSIESTHACRIRERELTRRNIEKEETLQTKIIFGKQRIRQHVESRLKKEFNSDKSLIRLINKSQRNDKKSKQKIYDFNGESKTIAEWAIALKIPKNTLHNRLWNGWSEQKTFSTPLKLRTNRTQ